MFELQYPKIPFLPVITEASKLPEYITYFYGLGIALAGALAVISLAIAGIRLIISPGNPESEKEAKEQIKGSILGLILLAASYLIISTINPQLVTPVLTELGEVPGIFYTNNKEVTPCPMSESDTTNIPSGYNTIIYKCAAGAYSPNLFIWKYPKKNFQDFKEATVEEIKCGETSDIMLGTSFKMAFKTLGVYYYLKTGCKGYMSEVNLVSGNISEPFKGEIKSIKIINNPAENEYYGFVVHKDPDLIGECELPAVDEGEEFCTNVKSMPVSSIDIFKWNGNKWAESGNGVVFYSEPFGWKTGQLGGEKSFSNSEIEIILQKKASDISFGYYSNNVPAGYRTSCSSFYNCPGSVELKGNYILAFYSQNIVSGGTKPYCQVFYKTITDFNLIPFPPEYRKLGSIYIIPSK